MSRENRHLTGKVSKRQIEQIEQISREENTDRSSALRKILDLAIREYKRRKAVEEYRKGRVSIDKASESAEVSIAEFYKILEDEGIPLKIDIIGVEQSLESDFGKH